MRRFVSSGIAAAALVALGVGGGATAAPDAVRPPQGALLQALAQPPVYRDFASQRIYFVMTDRYANGDAANDRGGKPGSSAVTGFEPADTGFFHGGDLEGLTGTCTDTRTGLARIKDIGFTALWLTPVVVQNTVQGDSAAYHGYWGLDFTKVDPHLGTNADFAALVECAHRLGMKVYLDVVVNHTGDVIRLDTSSFVPPSRVPYKDCHGKPFKPERYVRKRFPCMSAARMPSVPFVLPGDRGDKKPSFLNDVTNYHDRGDIDFSSCSDVCLEQGDFFGLDDLFTEKPAVWKGLAAVYGTWIRTYKLDGFRVDTAKHVNAAFFKVWTPLIQVAARAAGVRDFEVFGEVFDNDAVELSSFVRNRGVPNVLDFPLQDALVRYAGGSAGAKGVSGRLEDDDYFRGPDGVAPTPATFLGNHDIGRAAMQIKQQGGATGLELEARDELGHALLYLLRGAPVVYYGDEVGMIGRGGDRAAREDMFPTQVSDWRTEERVGTAPIGTGSSFDVDTHAYDVASYIRQLGQLRGRFPALATGSTIVREAKEGVLVVSRVDRDARHEYLVAFNASKDAQPVGVATATPSSAWTQWLGADVGHVESDGQGRVSFVLPQLQAIVLRADADLPRRGPAKATLRVGPDDESNLVRLTATIASPDPVSVTFAVRRARGSWRRLGTDDGAPYRAFLDPRSYKRGEHISLVAVVRASDGTVSVSKVLTFRARS